MSANISSVIAAASLSGSQYKTLDSAVQTLTNLHLTPVDVAAAATGVQNASTAADAVGAGISAAKAGLALVEAAVKAIPGAGTTLNLGSLATNLTKAANEQNGAGITNGTALGLAGDIRALLATASGLFFTGPAALALAVGLTAISAGFTVAGLLNPSTAGDPLFQDALAPTTLPYLPSGISDFDFWSIPGGVTPGVSNQCNRYTTDAINWVPPRRDPLVLDLDGGGITTSAINPLAPILFDQDGDGTKTATGWIAAGEAIVVRDLNGNGLIDSGRELFGDSTVLTHGPNAGKLAANGFEALADLDANADGKFDSADAAFASVKLWKDLNQDGISQASELFTFAELGVASGTAQLAGSLLLANNNFYRQFGDDLALTAEALSLQSKFTGITIDLIAGYARQSGATGQFSWRKSCHAGHQLPLTHRSKRAKTQTAHASCARLVGHKYLGRRMDAAWEFGCGALIAGEVTRLGVDEFTCKR